MIPKLPAGSRTQARDGDDPAMHAAMPRTAGDAASGVSPAGGRVYLTMQMIKHPSPRDSEM